MSATRAATAALAVDRDICAPCAFMGPRAAEDNDNVIVPWMRWVGCVFGGILFSVIAVTRLLYRDPGDCASLMPTAQPLGGGTEERAGQSLRIAHAALVERVRNVFGPADLSSTGAGASFSTHHRDLWLVGEEQVLFEVLKECLRSGSLPARDRQALESAFEGRQCGARHEQIVRQAVDHYCEAVARVMIVHSWYPQVSSDHIVQRMCSHSAALSDALPQRLVSVVERAARSGRLMSTVVLFYELRHTCHPPDVLTDRLLAVFNKFYCN